VVAKPTGLLADARDEQIATLQLGEQRGGSLALEDVVAQDPLIVIKIDERDRNSRVVGSTPCTTSVMT
jgi:hypothetical protein